MYIQNTRYGYGYKRERLNNWIAKTITVHSSEMLEALIEPAMMIVDSVHSVLEKLLQNLQQILVIKEYT